MPVPPALSGTPDCAGGTHPWVFIANRGRALSWSETFERTFFDGLMFAAARVIGLSEVTQRDPPADELLV